MLASTLARAVPQQRWWAFAFVVGMACSNRGVRRTDLDGSLPVPLASEAGAQDVPVDSAVDSSDRGTLDGNVAGDACVRASCTDPGCGNPYCGLINDGCGGRLDCRKPCPADWRCVDGMCEPSGTPTCVPLKCSIHGSFRYCGPIGDGCRGTLDCACPAGWACENSFCIGRPPVCTPATCDDLAGEYGCGRFDDGCGGTIECTCRQPEWICMRGSSCVAPPSICTPNSSCFGSKGEQYCGRIGDGCGGSLDCGDTCSSLGLACERSICGGSGSPPPVTPPVNGTPFPIPPPPCVPVRPLVAPI